MRTYARHASARRLGTRQRGKDVINTPFAALKMALHAADGDATGRGTDPAELIAAAIALAELIEGTMSFEMPDIVPLTRPNG